MIFQIINTGNFNGRLDGKITHWNQESTYLEEIKENFKVVELIEKDREDWFSHKIYKEYVVKIEINTLEELLKLVDMYAEIDIATFNYFRCYSSKDADHKKDEYVIEIMDDHRE